MQVEPVDYVSVIHNANLVGTVSPQLFIIDVYVNSQIQNEIQWESQNKMKQNSLNSYYVHQVVEPLHQEYWFLL